MKFYLAGAISDEFRKNGQVETVKELKDGGVKDIYAAALNDSINDKSNNPTPLDIYNADIDQVLESDVFIYTISGAGEDGTQFESGVVCGANDTRLVYNSDISEIMDMIQSGKLTPEQTVDALAEIKRDYIELLGFTTNERIMQPQFYEGVPSGGYNHLILGGVDKWGKFLGNRAAMLEYIRRMMSDGI